jgi:hypothetical protein
MTTKEPIQWFKSIGWAHAGVVGAPKVVSAIAARNALARPTPFQRRLRLVGRAFAAGLSLQCGTTRRFDSAPIGLSLLEELREKRPA